MKKVLHVEGMSCQHCVAHVKNALLAVDGVENADVSLENKSAVVTLTKEVADKALSDAVTEAGYEVKEITNP